MGSIKNWNVSLALEEVERNQKQKLKKELKQYWKDVLLLLQKPPDGSNLHNIARKDYEVKNLIVPENLEDPEQKVSLNLWKAKFPVCLSMICFFYLKNTKPVIKHNSHSTYGK